MMNHFKLKSALNSFLQNADKQTDEELAAAIKADPKGFSVAEQQEIFENVRQVKPFKEEGDIEEHASDKAANDKAPEQNVMDGISNKIPPLSDLIMHYKYRVEPVTGTIVGLDKKRQEILKGYRKIGAELQQTSITERHAERLNAQTPNSGFYFFTKEELLLEFIDAEKFF